MPIPITFGIGHLALGGTGGKGIAAGIYQKRRASPQGLKLLENLILVHLWPILVQF